MSVMGDRQLSGTLILEIRNRELQLEMPKLRMI